MTKIQPVADVPLQHLLYSNCVGVDEIGMGTGWRFALVALAGIMLLSGGIRGALADQIVLQSGRTLDGDIVAENEQNVTIDMSDSYHSIIRRVSKSLIKTINRTPHQGSAYVVLPVQGAIGVDITADALKAGIVKAVRLHPRYIMLYIDSDGGIIAELGKMVDALGTIPREIKTVAVVHKAYSAAAVLAMACPEIYLTPDSVIGGAVPYAQGVSGIPQDVDAKFKSIMEAQQRVWITAAGHDELLLRGMMEMDLELFLSRDDAGNPQLNTSGIGKLIKSKDKILTMTGPEAAECGLGRIEADFSDAGKQLSGGAVYEASERPWDAVIQVARKHKHQLMRVAALIRIAPEMHELQQRFEVLSAKSASDKDAVAYLLNTANTEVKQLDENFKEAIDNSRQQSDPNGWIAHAKEVRDAQYQQVVQNFQDASAPLKADQERADTEIAEIRERARELTATVPTYSD